MKNLLYKEFKLCLTGVNYLFLLFSCMVIIPNYPRYVPFFYICLSLFFIFNNGEINKDMLYSTILPIAKRDIVKARILICLVYELAVFVFTVPFSIIGNVAVPFGNAAGINANLAFYGLVCVPMTLFHYFFFTGFYKRGYRPGLPFLFGSIAFFVSYICLELPVFIGRAVESQFIARLDSRNAADFGVQLPFLLCGIAIYAIGWLVTYRTAVQRFESVDL